MNNNNIEELANTIVSGIKKINDTNRRDEFIKKQNEITERFRKTIDEKFNYINKK